MTRDSFTLKIVDHFINKFKKIPENKWCKGSLKHVSLLNHAIQRCVLGHCMEMSGNYTFNNDSLTMELINLFSEFYAHPALVNDSFDGVYDYFGTTPKERILTFLETLKESSHE